MKEMSQAKRIEAARDLRERLLGDPHRPGYHFAIPEDIGQPGDPNGAFYANGRYHLMYLYDRRGRKAWNDRFFCWGHISSADLIHWRHHPDPIAPGDGDGGCYSGGAFVDDDGRAYLSFWRLPIAGSDSKGSGIGIARSSDRDYERWEKLNVPRLDATEFGIREVTTDEGPRYLSNADPSNIWKRGGWYYLEAGNLLVLDKLGRKSDSPVEFRGDWVDLFRSRDLVDWEYLHRFYQRDVSNRWTDESEDDMCPSFLPLPARREGGEMSGKYLQLFISHNKGCQYYLGDYNTSNDLFIPQHHGRMSWTDNTFFAPEALVDDRGRQIMWAWLLDNPNSSIEKDIEDGWSGVYGLPRALWLGESDTLHMAPVIELETLRRNEQSFPGGAVADGQSRGIELANGMSCEIRVSISLGTADRAGLRVRAGVEEMTSLFYDREKSALVFDATASGTKGRRVVEEAPLSLADDEPLDLIVYIDNSVVEIFANDRQAITRRVYANPENVGVRLFSEGGEAVFSETTAWEMMPSNAW